jgi:hypothetical protein
MDDTGSSGYNFKFLKKLVRNQTPSDLPSVDKFYTKTPIWQDGVQNVHEDLVPCQLQTDSDEDNAEDDDDQEDEDEMESEKDCSTGEATEDEDNASDGAYCK